MVDNVPVASVADTARAVAGVIAPTLAQGVIARRPRVVGLAERFDLDRLGGAVMQRLHRRYGPGPVRLRIPGRSMVLVLSPGDVHRVLAESPEPFALANREKRGALGQFQPDGVLVSHGAVRADRRAFNEHVLDTAHPVHTLADAIVTAVREEATHVIARAGAGADLDWDEFSSGWRRIVRRVILGDSAHGDEALHADLDALRYRANWSYLRPRDPSRRDRLRRRLAHYVSRAEDGSLAGMIAAAPTAPDVDPVDQLPQWLFAADPAGMAAFRALALLAADPDEAGRVRGELAAVDLSAPQELRRLRAAVLESVRLWPTTPMVLRDTTRDTTWTTAEGAAGDTARGTAQLPTEDTARLPAGGAARLPAGTAVAIYAPYFHRDPDNLAYAHHFRPQNWLGSDELGPDSPDSPDSPASGAGADRGHGDWPLIPFSEGPGVCPGQNLVLLMTSTYLAALLEHHHHTLDHPHHLDPTALPAVVSPFHLRFTPQPRQGS